MLAQLTPLYIRTRPTKVISRLISYALFEGRPLTTRGRWINPFVFAHFALEKRLPQLKKVEKPIFVIGMGRSGTTVTGLLMSMHRDVGFLNEPKALWHSIFPEEDVSGHYARGPARYRLDAQDATEDVKGRAHRLFGAYLFAVASGRVVDKNPELIFRIPFVRAIFPDAKFVFIMRNGWDTCSSVESWSKSHGETKGAETHDWWGRDNRKWRFMMDELVKPAPEFKGIAGFVEGLTDHIDMSVVEWIVTMREGLRMVSAHPECIHAVRYEDIVSRPMDEMTRILDFCELRRDEVFLDYARKQIIPAKPKTPYKIAPQLLPLFEKTMKEMGY